MGGRTKLPFLLLALYVATPALAQEVREGKDFNASFATPWPNLLSKGYFPGWVELENTSLGERTYRLAATSRSHSRLERSVRKTVTLASGEVRRIELIFPILTTLYSGGYRLEVQSPKDVQRLNIPVDVTNFHPDRRFMVIFSPERLTSSGSAQIVDRLQTGDLGAGSGGAFPPGRALKATPNLTLSLASLDEFPSHLESYTSLDAVAVDVRGRLPTAEDLAPLIGWVRTGGQLVFAGSSARERLGKLLPEELFEARFEWGAQPGVYRCGLGRLFLASSDGLLASADDIALAREALWAGGTKSFVPDANSAADARLHVSIPELARLPLRVFLGILFAFAAVIGPVNFNVVRRRGRPALLLVTIPVLAIIFSLALLGYGIFYQGIDVKSGSKSLTVLDQRLHRQATVELRELYIGLSPGPGLVPRAGTAVLPFGMALDRPSLFQVDLTNGVLLKGGYQAVRLPSKQVLLSDAAERLRLGVRRESAGLAVDNTLPVTIEELFVRDESGTLHGHRSSVAPGGKITLQPIDESELDSLVPRHATGGWQQSLFALDQILPSSYAVLLAESPFIDPCGLELNERAGHHVLLGILPELEADWN